MLVINEDVDIMEKLLEHVCGTCAHAKLNENLSSHKRICADGYGFRHLMAKGCGAWSDAEIEKAPDLYLMEVVRR
jgi:hypothetical protein